MGYVWNKKGSIDLADGSTFVPVVGQDVTELVEMLDDEIVLGMIEEGTIADNAKKEEADRKLLKEQRAKLAKAKQAAVIQKASGAVVKAQKALEKATTDAAKKKAKEALGKAQEQLEAVKKG
jgi:hypothetical protein